MEREVLLPSPSELATEERKINQHGSYSSESFFSGFGSSSDLNTPSGSEIDSTETESEEDEFIAELTRQMADYMLQEDDDKAVTVENSKRGERFIGKSENPNSVLCQIKNQAFAVDQSQPPPPIEYYQVNNQPQIEHKEGSITGGRKGKLAYQQQVMQNKEFGHGRRLGFLPSVQAGPGMRLVFLGGTGSRIGSLGGTGVFLPHAANNREADQSCRKKPGYSTVLIPERVLQTLKHHFENKGAPTTTTHSNGGVHAQQNQQLPPPEMSNQDLQLPQEWTY